MVKVNIRLTIESLNFYKQIAKKNNQSISEIIKYYLRLILNIPTIDQNLHESLKQISISLSKRTIEKLKKDSKKQNKSLSELTRQIIEDHYNNKQTLQIHQTLQQLNCDVIVDRDFLEL